MEKLLEAFNWLKRYEDEVAGLNAHDYLSTPHLAINPSLNSGYIETGNAENYYFDTLDEAITWFQAAIDQCSPDPDLNLPEIEDINTYPPHLTMKDMGTMHCNRCGVTKTLTLPCSTANYMSRLKQFAQQHQHGD
jgi:hypothetical protein